MRVHHIALRTHDAFRLSAFYRDVLGLVVTRNEAGRIWLDAGGTIVMIEPQEPGEPGVAPGGMDLVAFEIAVSDKERFVERLGRAGVGLEGATDFTLYFRDPDGRRVGVSHYPST